MSSADKYAIIAAGGTGGHMFPAQSLAEVLLARGWRVRLSTDERGARYAGGFPDPVERVVAPSATFARGGIMAKILVPFRIAAGIVMTSARMVVNRPDVVIGFGGYPTIPAMAAAWLLRIPRVIHEQNGVLGRVNQLFAKRVDAIVCGTEPTDLPAGVEGTYLGNPVRASIHARAGAGYIPPGEHPMSILVVGGSQGARILSDVVPPAIAALPSAILSHIRVSQQARDEDLQRVADFYNSEGIKAEVAPFFDDIPGRMSEAQLVISRSGASSVADLTVIGRPAILVPLAGAIRDEQSANARAMADAGAAVVIPEAEFHVDALAETMAGILGDADRANGMARAALSLGRPDAAQQLATLVENLTETGGRNQ